MLNVFLGSPGIPPRQVSLNCSRSPRPPPPHPYILHTPLPPISLFWYFIWLFPCYQHHPPPLNTHYHCFHNPPYPCLAHPIPLPCPAWSPYFISLFWYFLWLFPCYQ